MPNASGDRLTDNKPLITAEQPEISRDQRVSDLNDNPSGKVIKAEVPLAEMFGYSTTLRSLSQGRATYTMEFKHYTEAPKSVAEAVINKKG